jgi:hypothetical protein
MPDFLNDYVKLMFGKEWWTAQFAKPEHERSPVCRWCADAHQYQKEHGIRDGDLYRIEPSGPHLAYLSLGYDLYVLKHHLLLQDEALKRMKRTPEFHGARYELLVAASFVRAGFDIRYEDETDNSRKHPEFIATHRATGLEFDVEAKKRNRLVKLDVEAFRSGAARIAIRELLAGAISKFRGRPYIVCLDLDVPPMDGNPFDQPWFLELRDTPEDAGARGSDGKDLFNMISFTNLPVEYTKDVPSFFRHIDMVSLVPKVPLESAQPLDAVRTALDQLGRIPSELD